MTRLGTGRRGRARGVGDHPRLGAGKPVPSWRFGQSRTGRPVRPPPTHFPAGAGAPEQHQGTGEGPICPPPAIGERRRVPPPPTTQSWATGTPHAVTPAELARTLRVEPRERVREDKRRACPVRCVCDLLAAAIGATAGILGGLAGQLFAARLGRTQRHEQIQLDDLRELQRALASLNRLYHRVLIQWEGHPDPSEMPKDLWEDYVAARADVLGLNERLVDDGIRAGVTSLRNRFGMNPYPTEISTQRKLTSDEYESVQRTLGAAIRRLLR